MEEKLEKIYEVIANKELSFGNIITFKKDGNILKGKLLYVFLKNDLLDDEWRVMSGNTVGIILGKDIIKAKGHPVIIGDVLNYDEKHGTNIYGCECRIPKSIFDINRLWKNKTLPIEDQSEHCIEYVYGLIK